MFCSTIIATINHPRLSDAVCSVLDQEFSGDDFEVIVVNDSGQPLPEMEWMYSERVRLVTTQKRERSAARNTGAAIAKGKYLNFLDQDDRLLPGSLQAFWELDRDTDATWLYGGYQLVDDDDKFLSLLQPKTGQDFFLLSVIGESIPLGASLLSEALFFSAGAFDPKFVIAEDRDLSKRMAFIGTIARTSAVVASFRVGREGSTGDWSKFSFFEELSREKILNRQSVFSRLYKLAQSNSYYHGRVSRELLASLVWNCRHGNVFLAMSRFVSFLAFTGLCVASGEYWRGLKRL
jgi:glycosyltransferase involved in cell wall biosynthesis